MKHCSDCPFVRKNPLNGSPEWLRDVLTLSEKNPYFTHTCHKTDPNADGFVGGSKVVECKGHLQIIFNEMDSTPSKGGVYNSIKEMGRAYLAHWQAELDRRKKMSK